MPGWKNVCTWVPKNIAQWTKAIPKEEKAF